MRGFDSSVLARISFDLAAICRGLADLEPLSEPIATNSYRGVTSRRLNIQGISMTNSFVRSSLLALVAVASTASFANASTP